MRIELHPEAEEELGHTSAYLEDEWPGLGERFLHSYRRVTNSLKEHPEAHAYVLDDGEPVEEARWVKLDNNMRYKVIFKHYPEKGFILIIAIAHFHQRPFYWRERVKGAEQ